MVVEEKRFSSLRIPDVWYHVRFLKISMTFFSFSFFRLSSTTSPPYALPSYSNKPSVCEEIMKNWKTASCLRSLALAHLRFTMWQPVITILKIANALCLVFCGRGTKFGKERIKLRYRYWRNWTSENHHMLRNYNFWLRINF